MNAPSVMFLRRDLQTFLKGPLWWYGAGLAGIVRWMQQSLSVEWQMLGIGLWARSFFRPMYGVTDIWGRMISIFARFFVILVRCVWWCAQALVYAAALLLWCAWIPLALALLFV